MLKKALDGTHNDEIEKALRDREVLHECGHMIDIKTNLLFRGVKNEMDSVEEVTATSMSFKSALNYGLPVMIVYVPQCRVRGLVVYDYDQKV